MRERFLPFSPPLIGEEEIQEVTDTLRSDWITTGPKTKRFETEFARYVDAPGAVALNSCTAGLHLALATLGIGPGDEVITTPMTFCATVNVIEHVGARPILVDVQADTLNIDPERIAAAITPHTRAIMPVHYAGHPVDLDPIMDLAGRHGIPIVEDAAHAVAARYRDRLIGAHGNPTAFSFYATKNLTTAEGGMLTGAEAFVDRARVLGLHGMDRDAWKRFDRAGSWRYDVIAPGFKYNMTDVQASIGLWQLKRLDDFQRRRCEIVDAYQAAFGKDDALQVPTVRPYVEPAWHLYVLRLLPDRLRIGRDQFIEELKQRNIGSSVHYTPIHMHSYYRNKYGYRPEDFPVACRNYECMLSLPLAPALTDQDVTDVITSVADIVQAFRR